MTEDREKVCPGLGHLRGRSYPPKVWTATLA